MNYFEGPELDVTAKLIELFEAHMRSEIHDHRAIDDFCRWLQQLRIEPIAEDRDTINDVFHRGRLRYVFKFNKKQRQDRNRYLLANEAEALEARPGLELIAAGGGAAVERLRERWVEAGGVMSDGRMIADPRDPVWLALSITENPWGPFDIAGRWHVRGCPDRPPEPPRRIDLPAELVGLYFWDTRPARLSAEDEATAEAAMGTGGISEWLRPRLS
jgi:hypothetical protein